MNEVKCIQCGPGDRVACIKETKMKYQKYEYVWINKQVFIHTYIHEYMCMFICLYIVLITHIYL